MKKIQKTQTGALRHDFKREFEFTTLPGLQPDQELIEHMRKTLDELKAIYQESVRKLERWDDEH